MKINWEPGAWDEYVDWQTTDKAMLKRINRMIKEIQRTPFEGIGKPEPLKHDLKWTPLSRQKSPKFKLKVHVQQKTCCALPW